ncbi:MAG TPA: hypothetical protein VN380_05195 [Thermoanaerobaculia bacterium]|nr:hypothetical protein [Thermoanaerobaculia bacterium]
MSSDGRIAAGLFVVAAVTFGYFTGGAGWNQDAHFDLTRAVVERHSLYVDGYDVNTGDLSPGTGGHTYINKPPGASLLAAIPYAIIFASEKLLQAPIDAMTRINRWIATALSIGLCGACIGPVLYLYGRRRIGATAPAALAVAATVLFGTMVFPYSTMLFAQIPSALFLLLAVVLLSKRPLLAGIAAGLSLSCFYVCGAAAPILFIVACARSRREAARFAIGCLPWVVLMGIYQWFCLGSPFRTAMEASTRFTEKGSLFGVLRLPSVGALYGITTSPYRGLFFASPVLLFAVIGLVLMARRRDLGHDLWAVVTLVAMFFLAIASFNGWNGGCAFGPRYLLPIVPLLGIPMLAASTIGSRPLRALWICAALLSLSINFIATATDPMPCPGVDDPIGGYLVPAFFTGRIPEEARVAFPWYPTRSVDRIALAPESGNLGELLFGTRKRASLAPIVAWLAGGMALLFRVARRTEMPT